MPSLTSNLTALRAPGHSMRWYLAAFVGTAVLTGAVTADAADGATSLAYTTSTGSSANVKRGFLVRVTTSGGALKGFWRVRASGTLNSTTMPITELSAGSVDVNSGDLLEVRNVILPGAKVTEADDDFNPDGLAAGTNNSAIPPIANAGPHDMGFVDSGQTYRTVTFPGSLSYAVDADSGGTITYSWVAATATGTTTSTSASPSFTFPVGEHLVVLTVTDSSNSATWTTYRKVRVYDSATLPLDVIVESIDSDLESGTSARFRVLDSTSLDDLPDGTLVGLFAREFINGTEQSFGNGVSGRSHIKCLGYLRRESNANTAEDGTQSLSFEIVAPLAFYRELVTGYSKVMQHNTGANEWDELDDNSVKRGIIQIPRWYTWLTEFHDLTFHSSFDDRDYSAFFIQRSNPIDQMHELADGVDARITSDRTGSVQVQMRPECIAEGSRSGITTWGTYTDSDRGDYSFEREHWRPIEMVEGRGFTDGTSTSSNQPLFSRWPGLAPGAGSTNTIVERLIADDKTDLNTRLGRRAAWEDGVYFTSTGVLHRALSGETTFPGSYLVFDPAYCEYFLQSFDETTNLRELDLADHRFVIQRVSFTPDEQGSGEVTVGWRTATNGPAGVTHVPPQESDNGLPPWTPPGTDFGPFPPVTPNPQGLSRGTVTLLVVKDDNTLRLCGPSVVGSLVGFDVPAASGGPVWLSIDPTALSGWPGGTIIDGWVDADSPVILGTGTAVNIHVITTTHWLRITDAGTTSRAISDTNAVTGTTHQRVGNAERGDPTFLVVASFVDGTGTVVDYSADRGANWSSRTVTAFVDSDTTSEWRPGLGMVAQSPGKVFITAFTATGTTTTLAGDGYVTTDKFATAPSRITSPASGRPDITPNNGLANSIVVPFQSADGNVAYFGHATHTGGIYVARLYRAIGAGTPVDISPTDGSLFYGPIIGVQRSFAVLDSDENVGLLCGTDRHNAGTKFGVWITYNLRTSAPSWTVLVAPTTTQLYNRVYLVARNYAILLGPSGAIAVWNGTTIDSRAGTGFGTGQAVAVMGA